ncbi:purine nucleoside permease [Pseudovirgaria hyperparasitica]|uniref:Purine nucleoside permease n=1 Tax=Pseudovirgaria hyperparasitica TaxID=470096 RepID=A0A6A6W1H2_9PEZI|nr:purine nucleoside permease [Pseudovirgaria hyperparasitica]KAF2756768.1 purine nucleoside permease [Pseudovirgaria hyperparasitica]
MLKPSSRRNVPPQLTGRRLRTRSYGPIFPKVLIISQFNYEQEAIFKYFPELLQQSYEVPGFSPLYPDVNCNNAGTLCSMTNGEGEANAAASITALLYASHFDLTHTYIILTGIAGVNPSLGTTGTVGFAKYAVQLDLTYEFDARQIPQNFSSGLVPQGNTKPVSYDPSIPPQDTRSAYPRNIYGTEVYTLNGNLRDKFRTLASKAPLNDTTAAASYRAKYDQKAARAPPSVLACDSQTSNVYWSGSKLTAAFSAYTQLLTNGSGALCMSQQEDNASLEGLLRGHAAGKIDFARVSILRAASDFVQAPKGVEETDHLLVNQQGGFSVALENIGIAARPVVKDVLGNWAAYEGGVKSGNKVGSLLVSY